MAFNVAMMLLRPFNNVLMKWDYKVTSEINLLISNSLSTKRRIKRCYNRDSMIIYPPVQYRHSVKKVISNGYYLIVSRLEPYKKVDIAIRAFNELNIPLIIIGDGSLSNQLINISNNNIKFFNNVSDDQLVDYYSNCTALIFPQEEDFGITPLEANVHGKPVICYGKGGVETTMVPYNGDNIDSATAYFFYEQTTQSLIQAVKQSQSIQFKPEVLLKNAKKFSDGEFKKKISDILISVNYNRITLNSTQSIKD